MICVPIEIIEQFPSLKDLAKEIYELGYKDGKNNLKEQPTSTHEELYKRKITKKQYFEILLEEVGNSNDILNEIYAYIPDSSSVDTSEDKLEDNEDLINSISLITFDSMLTDSFHDNVEDNGLLNKIKTVKDTMRSISLEIIDHYKKYPRAPRQ